MPKKRYLGPFYKKNRSFHPQKLRATAEDVLKKRAVYVGEILPLHKPIRATKWRRFRSPKTGRLRVLLRGEVDYAKLN